MPKLPAKTFSALSVKKLSKPGKYALGGGAYLKVTVSSEGKPIKRYLWRGTVRRQRREVSIGPVNEISLQEVRDVSHRWRHLARQGLDPVSERDRAKTVCPTFEEAARRCFDQVILPVGGNQKHTAQWIRTLETYMFPKIGRLAINQIRQSDILAALQPIWVTKHETARRTKQRVHRVFEYSRTQSDCGMSDKINPADGLSDALPSSSGIVVRHQASLPYSELPSFYENLKTLKSISALCLSWLILTATRSGETRLASWHEIDREGRVWTISPERMKGTRREKRAHRVPITDGMIEIIEKVEGLDDTYLFPSSVKRGQPLSDGSLGKLMRDMGLTRERAVPHGFRATFRTWAEEQTGFPHEVKEQALAHKISNKIEASYQRSDLFDLRHQLMNDWDRFVARKAGIVERINAYR